MKPIFSARLTPLLSGVQRHWRDSPAQQLWQAWISELLGLLPAHVRARLLPQVKEQYIDWPVAGSFHRNAGERPVLLLPASMVLAQSLQLPVAALRDLHSVVGYELDKYTPYPREQMHYVARVIDKGKTVAQVLLVAILRERLQALLDSCAEQGLVLDGMDCRGADGQPLGVDLLPAALKPPRTHTRRLPRYLAWTCATLLLTCMVLLLNASANRVERMQHSVEQQRREVQQVQALRRELTNTQGATRYLAQQKAARPTVSSVLVDLTGCLGADTWVEQLEIADSGGVSITGQSARASALISRMKNCQTLRDAQFQGIIQPDAKSGKEHFSLRAQLRTETPHAS